MISTCSYRCLCSRLKRHERTTTFKTRGTCLQDTLHQILVVDQCLTFHRFSGLLGFGLFWGPRSRSFWLNLRKTVCSFLLLFCNFGCFGTVLHVQNVISGRSYRHVLSLRSFRATLKGSRLKKSPFKASENLNSQTLFWVLSMAWS